MSRNYGIHARTALGGNEQPSARHRANTPRDLDSSYRIPAQSIFHSEDVRNPPLEIGSRWFVALFVFVWGALLIAACGIASLLF